MLIDIININLTGSGHAVEVGAPGGQGQRGQHLAAGDPDFGTGALKRVISGFDARIGAQRLLDTLRQSIADAGGLRGVIDGVCGP